MNDRKYFIDNIRWICILLLIPFHTAMAYNNWESNYIMLGENKILSSFAMFMCPWFMPIMFVLAGMSARYALKRRSYKQFFIERIKKLLIPLITGTFTVAAFLAYLSDKFYNQYSGNFFTHYTVFVTKLTDTSGYDGAFTPAHLWFLLYLFIISMLTLFLIMLQRKVLPKFTLGKIPSLVLPLLMVLPPLFRPILDYSGKSIGKFLILYLLGYYILSEEEVLRKLAKQKWIYLSIMAGCNIVQVYLFVFKGTRTGWLLDITNNMILWFGILGFLGLGRCIGNQNNKLTRYLSSQSFAIYIFHFGWLVWIQYLLSKTEFPTVLTVGITIITTTALTLFTCEIVKRIPGARWLYGMSKK